MFLLLIILRLSLFLGFQVQTSSDLFLNKLHMSFGINYKYNGLLHHNIDREWIITMVALPNFEYISFPDIAFDLDCSFIKNPKHSRTAIKQVENIRSICRLMKPLISLIKAKELHYESSIKKILKEEIPQSLQGLGYSHASSML